MRSLRHQPAVHSPVPFRGLAGASLKSRGQDDLRELRSLLARRFGGTCTLTDSGTHALQRAIAAVLRARPGPILVPAYTCYDIATAVMGAGADVRLYDLDPDGLVPDLDSVRAGLHEGASAVVAGPLYGYAFSLDELADMVREHGGFLIHDAAQAHGAFVGDAEAPSLGDATIISFGRGKGWTGGGGGALLIREPELATHLSPTSSEPPGRVALALKTLAQYLLARPSLYAIPASLPWLGLGETHYRDPSTPCLMSPWSAGLIIRSEGAAVDESRCRRKRGLRLLSALEGSLADSITTQVVVPPDREGCGYLRLPVLRDGGLTALPPVAKRLGVSSGYPLSLADLPQLGSRVLNPANPFKGAREMAARLITLPTHSLLRPSDERNLLKLVTS